MYRILIVDDEEMIREGLTQIIDWKEIGFEIAGTARNGYKAIEIIQKESLDVVILDIKMPKMNGLEVSRYLYENFPSIKIIILSGYAEFEYAQKTISYNVFSYLLKPSRKDNIRELFLRLKKEIDSEKVDSNLQLKGEYIEIKELINNLIGTSGFKKNRTLAEVQQRWLKIHSVEENDDFFSSILLCRRSDCRAVQELDDSNSSEFSELDALNKELIKIYGFDKDIFSFIDNDHSLCIFIQKRTSEFSIFVSELFVFLQEYIKNKKANPIKYSLGKKVTALEYLNESYKEAKEILSNSFEAHFNKIITKESIGHLEKAPLKIDMHKVAEEILRGLKKNNRDLIDSNIDNLLSILINSGIKNKNIIHNNVNELIISLIEQTIENQTKIVFPIKISNILGSLESIDSFECLNSFLHLLFERTKITSNYDDNDIDNVLIKIAMDKINSDLGKPHSLDSISESLDITSSYLSKLFKTETGINFKDYLMNRRLKKAQQLLKGTKYKIHEISKMIGFNDSHYFSKVFKKQTGYYPSDYRMNRKT